MRILKQTYQELVICHRQSGRWLVAGGCLLLGLALGLGALVVVSFTRVVVCPGSKQTPSCTLDFIGNKGMEPVE